MNLQKDQILILLLGSVLFLPFLGGVPLFDWDEINFAECAREMLETGDYFHVFIDYEPFWEKPPLFIWLQAIAMQLFGMNEFAARLPNAICGIITLLFLFSIGKKLEDRQFGWIWVLTYVGSILPHLYFRSGIIDPWFNLLIFSSLYLFIISNSLKENFNGVKEKSGIGFRIILAGALLGLAVLTKGPVAILIVGLVGLVHLFINRFQSYVSFKQIVGYGLSAFLVTTLWFGVEILVNGTWFIQEFVNYQIRLFSTPDAGHGGFPGFHVVVLLFGCFPASIFAIPAFWKSNAPLPYHPILRQWMLLLFWVVLILFSIVQSKIVHYSSLCYFPITYLASMYIYTVLKKERRISNATVNSLLLLGGLISLIFIALPFFGKNIDWLKPLFKTDSFALGNLEAEVTWTYWDTFPGLLLMAILITSAFFIKKGKTSKGIFILFLGSSLFIASSLYFFIQKIEGYSQHAAIEFYQSLEGKDVYVKNVGFKSYAPLFYTQKPKGQRKESRHLKWLTTGDIDKDVYIVTKIRDEHLFDHLDAVQEIGRKNGFIFFKRSVDK